jgi:hypothetical protein
VAHRDNIRSSLSVIRGGAPAPEKKPPEPRRRYYHDGGEGYCIQALQGSKIQALLFYVDDIEASADDEQIDWLRARFEERYEIKWLGFNSKNDSESNEKVK